MLLSTAPLVRASALELLTARPELHNQRVWLDYEDGATVGCVAGHAAFLAGLVFLDEDGWVRRTSDGTFMDGACDDDWTEMGRAALDISESLACSLFGKWVARPVAIEALRDLVDAVDEDVVSARVDRTVVTVPLSRGRAFLRDPRGYRRT